MTYFFKIIILFSIMNTQDNKIQSPLQSALNIDRVTDAISRESKGLDYLPIVIVTNGKIPLNTDLMMFNKKVILVADKESSNLIKKGHPYINITRLKVKYNKGISEFGMTYRNIKITVKVQREGNNWIFKSFYSKKRGNRTYEFDF